MLRVLISSKSKNQFRSESRFQIDLITKEIDLGLWSWVDLNSEGDAVEGVLGVGGDGSNSLKTVDRLSKSDEVGSDNVVRGFKDIKSLSSKRISVSNIVCDNDDMVADSNNSKDGKVCVADRMVSNRKKSIESATKGKYAKFKNVIVGEKKISAQKPSVPTKKGKHKGNEQIADTGKAIDDCYNVVSDIIADGKSDDIKSCDVKKGYVYVADHIMNDKNKSIKHATKGKAIARCDKVFSDVVADADNYVKPVDSTVESELKSVDAVYKCDKEYEDVPKKRTPSSRQQKIRLLMAYISNSLGGNIRSKDQLNYMHQLIAHGLINGVKLDYGGIIFNDLAAKLTNSVRHTSPAYARFISLILEKVLGDSYVLSDEIGLKIPIIGNSIFNLDLSLLEVPISSHMVRVCQSEPDPAVVSEDVVGILLCDNVSDRSPSIDSNLNEIVQKAKTKSINSLLDPKLKESTCVYKYKVVSNCLNEEVVADKAVAIGSGDQSLKDDCPVNSNQVYNYQNNVVSFQEEVVGDTAVATGSGDQSLKDDYPVNSNQVCNYQNNVALFQEVVVGDTAVPTDNSCSKELHIAPVVGDLMAINEHSDVKAEGVADNLMPDVVIKERFDDAEDYKVDSDRYWNFSPDRISLDENGIHYENDAAEDDFSSVKRLKMIKYHYSEPVSVTPEFSSFSAKNRSYVQQKNDIVNFKVEISNLANKT
ncbi:hypothetical protein Tco_0977199 [Tanacetum coccineum]|uniref:Uncharacterized protein n=1 Tax=Tanacetum coccineum TaxID=301880 RepID=A0ABQ5EKI3_9ASTR